MKPFFSAMQEKFEQRAKGECHVCGGSGVIYPRRRCSRCDGTGKENRSKMPWKKYYDPDLEPCLVCGKLTDQSFCSFQHAEDAARVVRKNRRKFRENYL